MANQLRQNEVLLLAQHSRPPYFPSPAQPPFFSQTTSSGVNHTSICQVWKLSHQANLRTDERTLRIEKLAFQCPKSIELPETTQTPRDAPTSGQHTVNSTRLQSRSRKESRSFLQCYLRPRQGGFLGALWLWLWLLDIMQIVG